ncbi:MAG TPA: M56 family metallopeptidase [Rugosimonospora sp.]|nr:M56 family metallopeptidase [Rugosimonospora sp.]
MTLAALLAAYSAGTAAVAPRFLAGAGWTSRAPRLGVLTWLTLASTTLLAALLGCATLVVPAFGNWLAHLLHTSLLQVRRDYGDTGGPAGVVIGEVAGSLLVLRLVYCAVRSTLDTRRVRLHHQASLALLDSGRAPGAPVDELVVLPHPVPAAYCVPGRPPRVVITSATRDLLEPDQLAGVLAHERAHLHGRHALLLGGVNALRRAFGRLPVFAAARREIGRLLEMRADDAATAVCDRVRLAEALVLLAEAGHRSGGAGALDGVLAVAGSDALARVRRLAAPYRPLSTAYQALTLIALLVCALLPVVVSVAPAVVAYQ